MLNYGLIMIWRFGVGSPNCSRVFIAEPSRLKSRTYWSTRTRDRPILRARSLSFLAWPDLIIWVYLKCSSKSPLQSKGTV